MFDFLRRTKKASKEKRERIALILTVALTVLIVGGWLVAKSTLSFEAPNETETSRKNVNPFSLIQRSFSNNFDQLQESVGFGIGEETEEEPPTN